MKKYIKDFTPDKIKANYIYKRKIKKYFFSILFFVVVITSTLVMVKIFSNSETLQILSMVITIFALLNLITFAWIFDFGAATKMRKNNFKMKGIKDKKSGHTFYYAIKMIGIVRIFINLILILIPLTFGITSYL